MSLNNLFEILIVALAGTAGFMLGRWIFRYVMYILAEKTTKEIERNPKWITPKLKEKYYGFSDIDIITVESPIGSLPRFRLKEKKNKDDEERLELLIPEDTSVNDIDEVAKLALQGKLFLYHNISISDKPAYWLSILCYMLDGGDINIKETEKDKKPIDVS